MMLNFGVGPYNYSDVEIYVDIYKVILKNMLKYILNICPFFKIVLLGLFNL